MKCAYFIVILMISAFFSVESYSEESPIITPAKPSQDIELYERQVEQKHALFAHERSYFLPFSYVSETDQSLYNPAVRSATSPKEDYYQNLESEFQISFFLPVARKLFRSDWDLNIAYTHHSWWQLYNSSWSKPFRETNYTPEIYFRYLQRDDFNILDFKLLGYDIGYMHQSNGQVQALSRSWDRVFARLYFNNEPNEMLISLSSWIRLPEIGSDDNTNILNYMGIGRISFQKNYGENSVELQLPLANHFGCALSYSYPWKEGFRWFVSYQVGTGHSLIEYNRNTNRIAIGVSLDNFFDHQPQLQ